MLNDISVFDLSNYIARRAIRLLCVSVIAGFLIGVVKFTLVYRRAAGLNSLIEEARDEMQQRQIDYEQFREYAENVPVNLIKSVDTYTATVTYDLISPDKRDGYKDEIVAFIDRIISAWGSVDISEVINGIYPDSVDDAAMRDVVQVSAEGETILRLTAKAESESASVSLLELFDGYLSEVITKEIRNSANGFSFDKSEVVTKCAYDKYVYWAQTDIKSALKDLKQDYQKAVDEYEELQIKNDPLRQAVKWGILGTIASALLYVCYMVTAACVTEPALSAEHVVRRTGLPDFSPIRKPAGIRLVRDITRPNTGRGDETPDFADVVRENLSRYGHLSLVCFSDETLDMTDRMIRQNAGEDSAIDGISIFSLSDYLKAADHVPDVLLMIDLDETRISEIKKAIEAVKARNCTTRGFVLL